MRLNVHRNLIPFIEGAGRGGGGGLWRGSGRGGGGGCQEGGGGSYLIRDALSKHSAHRKHLTDHNGPPEQRIIIKVVGNPQPAQSSGAV